MKDESEALFPLFILHPSSLRLRGSWSVLERAAEKLAADRVDIRLAVELLERQTHALHHEGVGPQIRRHREVLLGLGRGDERRIARRVEPQRQVAVDAR